MSDCFNLETFAPILYNQAKEGKSMRTINLTRAAALLLALALALPLPALAGDVLKTVRRESGASAVEYLQLEGLDNAYVQDTVNEAVVHAASAHLDTFAVLEAGSEGSLRLFSRADIWPSPERHDLLSVLLTAEGRMPTGRPGFEYIPLMFDLADGQAVTASDIFTNPQEALAWFEEDAYQRLSEDLSVYLDLEAISPFPLERLLVSRTGISFYYPPDTLTWLSGRSASFHYLFHEIQGLMNLSEGSFLAGLGIAGLLAPNEQTGRQVEEAAQQGRLPGLDASLGEALAEVIDRLKLLHDPEGFPEGEQYRMEDDSFRGSLLVSGDGQTVSGILSRRMNLFGLITGQADRAAVESALGQPFASLPLTESAAALYGLSEGSMSAYLYGDRELRIYFNQNGLMDAVWLRQQ